MGVKQIPVSRFIRYLESLGLIYVRTTPSHDYYNYPEGHPNGSLPRPITVRTKYKDLPLEHLHTNLKTLNISKEKFEEDFKSF